MSGQKSIQKDLEDGKTKKQSRFGFVKLKDFGKFTLIAIQATL